MTDVSTLLQHTAAQLIQEGKTPSLALFRSRLAGQVPAQQLFAAYQHWRNDPKTTSALPSATPTASTETNDDMLQTLQRIETKLDLLLSKLAP